MRKLPILFIIDRLESLHIAFDAQILANLPLHFLLVLACITAVLEQIMSKH